LEDKGNILGKLEAKEASQEVKMDLVDHPVDKVDLMVVQEVREVMMATLVAKEVFMVYQEVKEVLIDFQVASSEQHLTVRC